MGWVSLIKPTIVWLTTLSNNSLTELTVKYFPRISCKLVHSTRMCFTVSRSRQKTARLVAHPRPGNGEGLFLFRRFINLSLTYLLKRLIHLLTAPGPTRGRKSCRRFVDVSAIHQARHTTKHATNIDWLSSGFTSHSTQNRSFCRRSSQPVSWLVMKIK